MKSVRLAFLGFIVLACSCASEKKPLSEQLSAYMTSHVRNIDSTVTLSSFEVLRVDSINGKIGLMIEDSIYSLQRNGIQAQLDAVKTKNRPDSATFYQEEIDYMNQEIDSIKKLSATISDTARKYGVVVKAAYELLKNNRSARDTVYYIIALNGTIFNANRLDAAIQTSIKSLQ